MKSKCKTCTCPRNTCPALINTNVTVSEREKLCAKTYATELAKEE